MYRIITGIKNVVEYHVRWLRSVAFDARFNLDTTFKYSEDKQFPAIIPETQQGYEPVCPATLQKIISRLPINFEEFTFVDLGSGKGRAVLVAMGHPFKKVVGVEYSEYYHKIACQNIQAYRQSQPEFCPVELIHGDAATFPIPSGNVVLYLFNPFQGDVFDRVLANLHESLQSGTQQIYLAYLHPQCRQAVERVSSFSLFYEMRSENPYKDLSIYYARAGSRLTP
ncbi:MAG: class I SAM-dependent methyltransferase [Planctomycetales bacterium]|nr:class I SAM-dependent methyltransferase [Planctomycetales bacterium]